MVTSRLYLSPGVALTSAACLSSGSYFQFQQLVGVIFLQSLFPRWLHFAFVPFTGNAVAMAIVCLWFIRTPVWGCSFKTCHQKHMSKVMAGITMSRHVLNSFWYRTKEDCSVVWLYLKWKVLLMYVILNLVLVVFFLFFDSCPFVNMLYIILFLCCNHNAILCNTFCFVFFFFC